MKAHRLCLALWVAVAGMLAGHGATGEAAQKGTASPYAMIATELRQTRTLLQGANHDYDGHRAKAVHEVTKAVHALVPAKKKNTAPKSAQPSQPPVKEDQAKSDAQMAQAAKQLQTILTQLSSLTGDAHAAAAMPHVQTAINEINLALKIR